MSRRTALTLVLLCTLVLSAFTAVAVPPPGLPGDTLPDASASKHDSYAVEQGDTCVPITPIRGNETVAEFYDYRNPYTDPSDWSYSSFAPRSVTRENGSTMFLYESPDGVVSLVILHDRLQKGRTGQNLPMTAASFDFDGLPESGQWVVMDDTYDGRDDRWSRNSIDWRWAGSRVDGAVFRGLSGEFRTTISPAWNEDAALHDSRFDTEPIDSWSLLSGSASSPNETELDMGTSVVVRPGTCGSPPEAALSAQPSDSPRTNQSVTFDAGGTTDPDDDLTEFRWDFDGDGQIDETTTEPTATHSYESSGEKTARLTAVDSEGSTDNATVTFSVSDSATDTSSEQATSPENLPTPGNGLGSLPGVNVLADRPELGAVVLAIILLAGTVVARR